MNSSRTLADGLGLCLALGRAHASLSLKLDDALGAHHGLGWTEFRLLDRLARAEGGRLALGELARPLGLPLSAVLRQVRALEKTGHVERPGGAGGPREAVVQLRPAGRAALATAAETAAWICAQAVDGLGLEDPLQWAPRLDALAACAALRT